MIVHNDFETEDSEDLQDLVSYGISLKTVLKTINPKFKWPLENTFNPFSNNKF